MFPKKIVDFFFRGLTLEPRLVHFSTIAKFKPMAFGKIEAKGPETSCFIFLRIFLMLFNKMSISLANNLVSP